LPLISTLLC